MPVYFYYIRSRIRQSDTKQRPSKAEQIIEQVEHLNGDNKR